MLFCKFGKLLGPVHLRLILNHASQFAVAWRLVEIMNGKAPLSANGLESFRVGCRGFMSPFCEVLLHV